METGLGSRGGGRQATLVAEVSYSRIQPPYLSPLIRAMNQHEHDKHHHGQHHPKKNSGLHKDWRVWVVGLMLLAMLIYVLSDNEAIQPDGADSPPIEAAP